MYKFPKDLYTDVRLENVFATTIYYENKVLVQNKTKVESGAMVRVFDGSRWYYSSITNLDDIQKEIDSLANMAVANPNILDNEVVKRLEVHNKVCLKYKDNDISQVSNKDKVEILNIYLPLLDEYKEIKSSKLYYVDNYTKKRIISSIGADVTFDSQNCAVSIRYTLMANDLPHKGSEDIYKMSFDELKGHQDLVRKAIEKDLEYASKAVSVVPGEYTCVLSPETAGVFAHESFGHKSESDFMIGDETMKKEWAIGSKVGSDILNIIDTGCIEGSGYVPFDDEGCEAKENYIIKNGILTGRLHSAYTAAALEEEATGNARAMSFEFEPIVRMTTTYIGAGKYTKDELFSEVKNGIYIEDILHGSGMTTFTIAPKKAYMIRDGKIAEPVKISVISGNVMKTLNEIDGLSDTVELKSFVLGGCGKMEQYPLRVGFGGPYVRVNGIKVQ